MSVGVFFLCDMLVKSYQVYLYDQITSFWLPAVGLWPF